MTIQMPSEADVASAVTTWCERDPRLAQLMQRYGTPAPALRHYGLVLWGDGDLQPALQVLSAAVGLTPTDALLWGDLASVCSALGRTADAAVFAERGLRCDPSLARLWLQLGAIRSALDDQTGSIEAYQRALAGDATLVEGWVGLGLAQLGAKRFREAVHPFRQAIALGKAEDAGVQGCLGEALLSSGDFRGAAAAFDVACRLQSGNQALRLKQVAARFAVDAIDGPADVAVAACRRSGLDGTEIETIIRDGFHRLSAHGDRAAAIGVGDYRLAAAPDDAMQAYLLATLKGEPMERAPDRYIVTFFDQFADDFDTKLVDVLGYRVPVDLANLAQQQAERSGRPLAGVLDLGCGTGLVGARLARPGRAITGVDLSPRMLDRARVLGCYDHLVEAEILSHLAANRTRYDLLVGADVLIYFGNLSVFFEDAARALSPGGLLAVSIETSSEHDIVHLASGRFAHSLGYIAAVSSAAGIRTIDNVPTDIRLDAEGPARGTLLLFEKP